MSSLCWLNNFFFFLTTARTHTYTHNIVCRKIYSGSVYNYFGPKQKDMKCSRSGGDIKALIIHTIIEKYTHTVYAFVSFRWVLCLNTVCHIREVLYNTALHTHRQSSPTTALPGFTEIPSHHTPSKYAQHAFV